MINPEEKVSTQDNFITGQIIVAYYSNSGGSSSSTHDDLDIGSIVGLYPSSFVSASSFIQQNKHLPTFGSILVILTNNAVNMI